MAPALISNRHSGPGWLGSKLALHGTSVRRRPGAGATAQQLPPGRTLAVREKKGQAQALSPLAALVGSLGDALGCDAGLRP